jgi:hypothetical protein
VSHLAGGAVQERQQRSQRDCTPYNGPFGFYGNVWCQPPNEQSYMWREGFLKPRLSIRLHFETNTRKRRSLARPESQGRSG